MQIISARDYDQLSWQASKLLEAQLVLKPDSVLGLATGSSPLGIYAELVRAYQSGAVDFSHASTVNLDEYVGLPKDHPQSYARFMREHLFDHVNINPGNTHIPDGMNPDAAAECTRYDGLIRRLGGIDLQLLGLGPNGHIGFNEPEDHFPTGTHKVTLTEATIQANKRFFDSEDQVPRFAYTMGVREIMQSRHVVLVVSGEGKAEIVKEAFFGPVRPQVPASILQLHRRFTLVADEAALSKVSDMVKKV